ncbi:MAG: hypothetical protein ACI4RQ_03675 [Methanobrevibacter wolinii]|uniref:hypothetical protein n=1 Tax=Methanobrevibacter wolinii TaxID=190977 RepID=UPI0005B2B2E5|nr:hypothetical protein [Methanobrevibacter wolinii]MDD5960223.1 hypothetical protein [Methanobrevibacter wolinii]
MDNNSKSFLLLIFIIIISGIVCIAAVYATVSEENLSSNNKTSSNNNDTILSNNTSDVNITNNQSVNISDNSSNHNISTITVHMKPSVETGLEYKYYTRTWVNYCPFCHKFGTLTDTPKDVNRNSTVPEGELTCDMSKGGCDADFDGVSGKDKLWRDVYLTPADGNQIISLDNGTVVLKSNGLTKKQNIRDAQLSILNQENAEDS